jgi:hypothetical protein
MSDPAVRPRTNATCRGLDPGRVDGASLAIPLRHDPADAMRGTQPVKGTFARRLTYPRSMSAPSTALVSGPQCLDVTPELCPGGEVTILAAVMPFR